MRYFLFIIICLVVVHCAQIKENEYTGVVISFSAKVSQEEIDLNKLKAILQKTSEYLYHATRRRAYFGEFIISLPPTWPSEEVCDEYVTKVPQGIDLYVTDSSESSILRAQHSRGCGEKGDVIYMPRDWLRGDTEDLARHFLQQWSIHRYGVFEERSDNIRSCFSYQKSWSPSGCYNVQFKAITQFDEKGLPTCYLPNDFFTRENLKSSIMFTSNSSKILDYCDGSASYPHNPVMPTPHNKLCRGKTVWSVIKNSEDFKYARNLPREEEEIPKRTAFRCFREPSPQLTLAVQTNSDRYISNEVIEIRYALLHFLSNVAPVDAKMNLVTFSDTSNTENGDIVELNLRDTTNLDKILDNHVRTTVTVSNVCLSCGVQKALNASMLNEHPHPVVVLIAWESALVGEKQSDLVEKLINHGTVTMYIIFVEDTVSDVVPTELMDAVQASGGEIFKIAKEIVFRPSQLSIALVNVFKNPMHIEDKIIVVHEGTYIEVKSDVVDSFAIQEDVKGHLLYMMHCSNKDIIESVNSSCSKNCGTSSNTCRCIQQFELNDKNEELKYTYKFKGGIDPLVCSSLAMIKVTSRPKNSVTLRGWLSHNKITPGYNALIIYAEVTNSLGQDIQVEARVSGPGLAKPFKIDLRDNGNGDPDVKKGDGVFSRYFTSFSQKGTYVVTLFARITHKKDTNAEIMDSEVHAADKLTQTKVIGSFSVTQTPPKNDILPPNRVVDLTVASVNHQNSTVTLRWTAPGDNYDYGRAAKYVIKFSSQWMNLLDLAFNNEGNMLKSANELKPQTSGLTENIEFFCPVKAQEETYYIALRAIDAHENEGIISNIIQVYLKRSQLDITESQTTTDVSYSKLITVTLNSTEANNVTKQPTEIDTNFTETDVTANVNFTTPAPIPPDSGEYIEKRFVILITSAAGGAFLLTVIIINIIICCCCLKKEKSTEKKKKLSRKASLRPPYNINIAYKQESQSSLNIENDVAASTNTLADQSIYSDPQGHSTRAQYEYSYHTSKSLSDKTKSKEHELGFKLVQAMPAYATTSLSHYNDQHDDYDNYSESSEVRTITGHQKPRHIGDAQVYPLGLV